MIEVTTRAFPCARRRCGVARQWRDTNLLMVSIIYERRAIPVYFTLLEKKGNSNLAQQQQVLLPVFELLEDYKITVLGGREFCGVELGKWLLQ